MSEGIRDPRADALAYMDDKKISILFDILGAKLAKEKPENPNEFLINELKHIADLKAAKEPVTLFSKDDVDTMFTTFDITNKGYVSLAQYKKALLAVGLNESAAESIKSENITRDKFVDTLYAEILKNAF